MSYSSEVLADSPLGYWRLGEASGTTMTDASGNGHGGTYGGTVTLGVPGALTNDSNTALSDNGAGYGEATSATWLNTTALTVECWIKTGTASGNHSILDRCNGSGSNYTGWQFRTNAGAAEFILTVNAATKLDLKSTASVADDLWHHIVATYDGTTGTLYVDGTSVATATYTGGVPNSGTDGVRVGASRAGSSSGALTQYWIGSLDEAATYGVALSAARVLAHYNAANGVVTGIAGDLQVRSLASSASLAGGYATPPPRGDVAAQTPRTTSTLAGFYDAPPISGQPSAVARLVTSSLSGSYSEVVTTDTANRLNGRIRDGYGLATYDPPTAATPSTLVLGTRVDKAIPLPTPDLVNGRPT